MRVRLTRVVLGTLMLAAYSAALYSPAHADEEFFTYVKDASVLPEGVGEVEQWITSQSGKREGDYSEWDFRTEVEYGLTSTLQGSVYLNFDSINQSGVPGEEDENSTDFKGVSLELQYQVLNPNLDPVGFALYGEFTTDGLSNELESKLIFSKPITEKWMVALNAIYEAEFEREDQRTEQEATVEFTGGVAYRFTPKWSTGLELRNKTAYPGGLDLQGQEYNTWSVGPNLHYGTAKGWATLTVLPQVWGNGDGSDNGRQLVHEEALEVRLKVGVFF